jgi:hypothetical protein
MTKIRYIWNRMMKRDLNRFAVGIVVVCGFMEIITPPYQRYYGLYQISHTLFILALLVLIFGFIIGWLDYQERTRYTPMPTRPGSEPKPKREAPLPYPDPNAPVDEAKRKMRMLEAFSDEAEAKQKREMRRRG